MLGIQRIRYTQGLNKRQDSKTQAKETNDTIWSQKSSHDKKRYQISKWLHQIFKKSAILKEFNIKILQQSLTGYYGSKEAMFGWHQGNEDKNKLGETVNRYLIINYKKNNADSDKTANVV